VAIHPMLTARYLLDRRSRPVRCATSDTIVPRLERGGGSGFGHDDRVPWSPGGDGRYAHAKTSAVDADGFASSSLVSSSSRCGFHGMLLVRTNSIRRSSATHARYRWFASKHRCSMLPIPRRLIERHPEHLITEAVP
jgi:hypothetical protein